MEFFLSNESWMYLSAFLVGLLILTLKYGWRLPWPWGNRETVYEQEHHNAYAYIAGLGEVEILRSYMNPLGNVTTELIARLRRQGMSEDFLEGLEAYRGVPFQEYHLITTHGLQTVYNIDMIPTDPAQLNDSKFYIDPAYRKSLHELKRIEDSLLLEINNREAEIDQLVTDKYSFMMQFGEKAKYMKRCFGGAYPIPMQRMGSGASFSTQPMQFEGGGE